MDVDFELEEYISDPKNLARKVLEKHFEKKRPSFPIDPFEILDRYGVVYQFRDFKQLEGVYLVPQDNDDVPLIGINVNRPITRQRFTAAHELCHHIKDGNTIACPIGVKSYEEKYADKFASELLMPSKYLREVINVYKKDNVVSFEDAVYVADYFGVSFRACINRLAWEFNVIDGEISNTDIKRRISKFKPDIKRIEYGLPSYNLDLLRNILNSNKYFFIQDNDHIWLKFKNDFVYNENRIEGVLLCREEVSAIVTDLRLHGIKSAFCKETNSDVIEVAGHASLYDYIFDTDDKITAYKMVELHQKLFQYSPHPEFTGKTRTNNNYVLGAKFETVDHSDIMAHLMELDIVIQRLIKDMKDLSITDFIDRVLIIHHKITYIHPFYDGNGRISRIMMNWLFRLKGLPPIYLNSEDKKKYFQALECIDSSCNYRELQEIIYRAVLKSTYELNSKFII